MEISPSGARSPRSGQLREMPLIVQRALGVGDGHAVEGDGVEVPGDAARQGVGEADVIRRPRADVGDDDGELGDLAGADGVVRRPS